jgi:hypothetical protein
MQQTDCTRQLPPTSRNIKVGTITTEKWQKVGHTEEEAKEAAESNLKGSHRAVLVAQNRPHRFSAA